MKNVKILIKKLKISGLSSNKGVLKQNKIKTKLRYIKIIKIQRNANFFYSTWLILLKFIKFHLFPIWMKKDQNSMWNCYKYWNRWAKGQLFRHTMPGRKSFGLRYFQSLISFKYPKEIKGILIVKTIWKVSKTKTLQCADGFWRMWACWKGHLIGFQTLCITC
jgi:hypothetical protein